MTSDTRDNWITATIMLAIALLMVAGSCVQARERYLRCETQMEERECSR